VSAKDHYTGPVRTIDEAEFEQPAEPIAT
jgi:hypothetical protein